MPLPLLYLSAFFEAIKDEYYKQLYNVRSQGTWHDWLIYFLNGVALQAADVLRRAENINLLLTKWQEQVISYSSKSIQEIIKFLATNPYFTIKKITEKLNIVFTTAA